MKLRILLCFFFSLTVSGILAQNRLKPYEEYITKYADIARDQQNRYRIPASITMAQGLIESGAGKSKLAIESNNHFGIKCHNSWKGETVTAFDDGINSCFRKYGKVEQSYEDHSEFLVNGARYRFLFDMDILDYKGWANGLQKAGYATDRSYADKLIRTIETYDLNELTKGGKLKFDKSEAQDKKTKKQKAGKAKKTKAIVETRYSTDVIRNAKDYNSMETSDSKNVIIPISMHVIEYVGSTPCIYAKYGDSFASIAEEFGLTARRIIKYNDFPEEYKLTPGEIVYLDKKSSWWEGENPMHKVAQGETMLSIAQKYGLRLKALYKLNEMKPTDEIHAGQKIKLRNPEQMSNFVRAMNESINNIDSIK